MPEPMTADTIIRPVPRIPGSNRRNTAPTAAKNFSRKPRMPAPNMMNEEADFPKREKNAAKSCCLAALIVCLVFFFLVLTAIVGIIIVDTVNLRGENISMSKRVERYKVAGQFIWFDFKDWVSKKWSGAVYADDFRAGESSPSEPEIVQCPADPPETEPGTEPESELESGLDSESDSEPETK